MKQARAFTIVELLIVIVVIAVLAAISSLAINGVQKRSRDASRASDINQVVKKIELYYAENGKYPSTGGLNVAYTDSKCNNANPNKFDEWVPGLSDLPQSKEPRQNGYGCYNYASDGNKYAVSAWRALENEQTTTMYRRSGFRESGFSNADGFHCEQRSGLDAYWDPFYKYSYTVANFPCVSSEGYF